MNPRPPGPQPGALTTELHPPCLRPFLLRVASHPARGATRFPENMVRPAGFEPATYGLEVRCSIQLSYGRPPRRFFPWRPIRRRRFSAQKARENITNRDRQQRLDQEDPSSARSHDGKRMAWRSGQDRKMTWSDYANPETHAWGLSAPPSERPSSPQIFVLSVLV